MTTAIVTAQYMHTLAIVELDYAGHSQDAVECSLRLLFACWQMEWLKVMYGVPLEEM